MPVSQAPPHPFGDFIGLKPTQRGNGFAVMEQEAGPNHMNPCGVVNGSVAYAMLDSSMGGAVASTLVESETTATLEIKVIYLRVARPGTLRSESRVIHRTRRFAVVEGEVRQHDKVIARASGTFAILPTSE